MRAWASSPPQAAHRWAHRGCGARAGSRAAAALESRSARRSRSLLCVPPSLSVTPPLYKEPSLRRFSQKHITRSVAAPSPAREPRYGAWARCPAQVGIERAAGRPPGLAQTWPPRPERTRPLPAGVDQQAELDAELRKGVQAALASKAKGGSSTAYSK